MIKKLLNTLLIHPRHLFIGNTAIVLAYSVNLHTKNTINP